MQVPVIEDRRWSSTVLAWTGSAVGTATFMPPSARALAAGARRAALALATGSIAMRDRHLRAGHGIRARAALRRRSTVSARAVGLSAGRSARSASHRARSAGVTGSRCVTTSFGKEAGPEAGPRPDFRMQSAWSGARRRRQRMATALPELHRGSGVSASPVVVIGVVVNPTRRARTRSGWRRDPPARSSRARSARARPRGGGGHRTPAIAA